ncbi:hypothetical protein K1719_004154 [Acacia pycnantha]|nr:hypothetical protein K1719_004154 [Acacia pycnantha]
MLFRKLSFIHFNLRISMAMLPPLVFSKREDEILQIFGFYGEIKEIYQSPETNYDKFIEFYDVQAAEAALRALNKSEITGKQIKREPSHPRGSTATSLMQQSQKGQNESDLSHTITSSGVIASGCLNSLVDYNCKSQATDIDIHGSEYTLYGSYVLNVQTCLPSCRIETLNAEEVQNLVPGVHLPLATSFFMPKAFNIHSQHYLQALFGACENLFEEEYDAVIICLGAKVNMLPEIFGRLPLRTCRGVILHTELPDNIGLSESISKIFFMSV